MERLQEGQDAFKSAMSPDELRQVIDSLPTAEREAFIVGARAFVEQAAGTARNDAAGVIRMFQQGWNAEKLRILVGDQPAKDFLDLIQREAQFQQTGSRITANSETAARVFAQSELSPRSIPQRLVGTVASLFRSGGIENAERMLASMSNERAQALANEAAELLTRAGPERDAAIQMLVEMIGRAGQNQAMRQKIENFLNVAAQGAISNVVPQVTGYSTGSRF